MAKRAKKLLAEAAGQEHDWEKTNLVTLPDMTDEFKCRHCEVRGVSHGLGEIQRAKKYRAKKWAGCPGPAAQPSAAADHDDPPTNSPADLGYVDVSADYTPKQRTALRETFAAIRERKAELANRKSVLGDAQDAVDVAKESVKEVQGEISKLEDRLEDIDKGSWGDDLFDQGTAEGGEE